jgi:DNA-binding response OmpR family regulator
VLLAEDNIGDVTLVQEALSLAELRHELVVRSEGDEMLAYIDRIDAGSVPCPDVVILDLNLPKVSGHALLQRLRRSHVCGHVPVIIATSSNSQKDRAEAERLGATCYFRKPSDLDEFMALGALVKSVVENRPN